MNPPAQFVAGNQQPKTGRLVIKPIDAGTGFPASGATTDDGQAQLFFGEREFVSGPTQVEIDLKAVADHPQISVFQPLGNVYFINVSAPLAKPATISLRYPPDLPPPSGIWWAPTGGGAWTRLEPATPAPYFATGATSHDGYFVAGLENGTSPSASGGSSAAPTNGGSLLPLVAGIAVVVVLLAGLPLVLLRRRDGPERRPPPRR
ncbi:MAG: hypothetical protein M3024_06050 [Candidatus Dormibacteraeota bacterium]|nr:hypothetical protein [Candidatus Dormibacteraeota bacterium]